MRLPAASLLAISIVVGGCNGIFGVDELTYDANPGGTTTVSSTTTSSGGGGSAGMGGSAGGAGVAGGGGGDGGGGAAAISWQEIGYAALEVDNIGVSVQLSEDVAEGTSVLALVAGRGTGPVTLADDALTAWTPVVTQPNSTSLAWVAAFRATAGPAFGANTTITAQFGQVTPFYKALLVLTIEGSTSVFPYAAPVSGTDVTLASQAVTSQALAFAWVATGINGGCTYDAPAAQELHAFNGTFSSGAFFLLPTSANDAPLLQATASEPQANHSVALVVLE